jgi:hypothetical protein
MKCWQRTNRNSLAQFMRSRVRWFHVSKAPQTISLPLKCWQRTNRNSLSLPHPTNPELMVDAFVWPKGTTYRKPAEENSNV